jgi:hypothetical protein
MMGNPYTAKPPEAFWKLAVATRAPSEIAPIAAKRFHLTADDAIATAGSCFAQNVARYLKANPGVRFLEAEVAGPNQPQFSALYGNIYTARQLLQLVDEALASRQPAEIAWKRADGAYVDALRPTVFPHGFHDAAAVARERLAHCAAVRSLLFECTVFIFTLGLTEAWRSSRDGTVYPLAPGVMAEPESSADFEFHNFTYEEVQRDLEEFIARLKEINPGARLLLTVSPVPLTATWTDENVLVATSHSKAILRAVCSAVATRYPQVYYFPAYEIITGNFSRGRYFDENLRSIAPEGVAHVMRVFEQTYGLSPSADASKAPADSAPSRSRLFSENDATVICDEPEIVRSLGF